MWVTLRICMHVYVPRSHLALFAELLHHESSTTIAPIPVAAAVIVHCEWKENVVTSLQLSTNTCSPYPQHQLTDRHRSCRRPSKQASRTIFSRYTSYVCSPGICIFYNVCTCFVCRNNHPRPTHTQHCCSRRHMSCRLSISVWRMTL